MSSVEMENFSGKSLNLFMGAPFFIWIFSNSSQLHGQEILIWLALTLDILTEDVDVKLLDLDPLKTLVDCANNSISNLTFNQK